MINNVFFEDQIGSDEVGTGDFCGPIIVVAALVTKKNLSLLQHLGIRDSKKISDKKIIRIGSYLVKNHLCEYSALTLNCSQYNRLIMKGFHMVSLKCWMHQTVLFNLHQRYPKISYFCIDQFVNSNKYYDYIPKEKKIPYPIHFHIKGEQFFPSVALASVLARYSFLCYLQRWQKKYCTVIPRGSNSKVDTWAASFAKKYGITTLNKIIKQNFRNYQRVLTLMKKK